MNATVRSCCLLPVVASLIAGPAFAGDQHHFRFDIAAGPLNESLAAFSAQSGVSIGMPGAAPTLRVPALKGRYSAEGALHLLLRGTGWRARKIGPGVYRIEPEHRAMAAPRGADAPAADAEQAPDIVVTGRKQSELLSDVPAPMGVYAPDSDGVGPPESAGSREVVNRVVGLGATNAGPGAAQLFIRGTADSPFLGFGQSTVTTLFNDSRITFSGPDPDLHMVDIERVEILRGPQGPLYGTGAIGGAYRLVPHAPVLGTSSLQVGVGTNLGAGDLFGGGAMAIANLPLAEDQVAVRLVGYGDIRPGWITDIGLARHSNWSRTWGGRLGVRVAPVSGWTIDLTGALQQIRTGDSQYVQVDDDNLERLVSFREPLRSRFGLFAANVEGPVGRLDLTIASSISWHRLTRDFDATLAAAQFGVVAPALNRDDRHYRVIDQEVRIAGNDGGPLRWMGGVSYLQADDAANGTLTDGAGATQTILNTARQVSELAAFGKIDYHLFPTIRFEGGARIFLNRIEDDRTSQTTPVRVDRFVGFSPSVSLSWRPREGMLAYVRYASAIRPGGLAIGNPGNRYDADETGSFDAGYRLTADGGRLSMDLSLFRSTWSHIQSNYLLDNGLVSTRNVGDSHALGFEAAMHWNPVNGWILDGSLSLQRARLVRSFDGSDLPTDRRVPIVPDVSINARATHQFTLGPWQASTSLALRFNGNTRLSFDTGLDRQTTAYALIDLNAGIERGAWRIGLYIDNLADVRADTFAFGNPFSVRTQSQYTPARPRTIGLRLSYSQ